MSASAPPASVEWSAAATPDAASSRQYPAAIRILHWLTALLIAAQIMSGVVIKQLGSGPTADFVSTLHKTSGVVILALVLMRLAIRFGMRTSGRRRRYPSMLPVHVLLYAATVLIPLLGWAGVSDYGARGLFFGWSLPAIWPQGAGYDTLLFTAHAYLAFVLLALVAIHIGVAVGLHLKRGPVGEDPLG